ncbi:hypothetical protein R3W88_000176 [Solanum pinnatisectum]|uniref:Acid phosphatase/vanadium-dependent haloperoxidase-related protein n=1 Tax=Solanum pinnatisectum TaxID=50273 RepID=A0AAV9MEU9_9SOLN|nr:hypothetical protein R3W88_000176 [Solanum pinnatisectum]
MLLLQNWGYPSAVSSSFSSQQNPSIYKKPTTKILVFPSFGKHGRCFSSSSLTYKPLPKLLCLHGFGLEDITDVVHNKVLVAAAISAAVGQLMKPFTSSLFNGNEFNFKTAFQAGGFPSTHSSAVVATATALGLERGFSDSIFGLAVVYAGLVMYDAQGVRREVGIHAKAFNKALLRNQINSVTSTNELDVLTDSIQEKLSLDTESFDSQLSEESSPFQPRSKNATLLLKPDERRASSSSFVPLKEQVGHTEVEVIAGAFLGFFVSLAVSLA